MQSFVTGSIFMIEFVRVASSEKPEFAGKCGKACRLSCTDLK